ncbi:MAG: hypothetical protein K2O58_02780 [Bacteroidales bacterium]|nr:hypothetical protein [Bacteroidales bacterium]
MKDIFDIKRFGKYFASDFMASISRYGLSFLLISLMGLIIYAGTVIMGLLFDGTWGGPSIYFRTATFAICIAVLVLTMPAKIYGHITEKRAGSTWLMIPASTFEKFLSMILICGIVVPAMFTCVYLGTDALLCIMDKTCGTSICHIGKEIAGYRSEIPEEVMSAVGGLMNPLSYIDDMIGSILIFLLGAICFKNAKVVKTILFLIVLSMALSIIGTPFMYSYMETLANNPAMTLEEFFSDSWLGNLSLIDTVSDIAVIVIATAGIFFRLKTIKH